MTRLVVLWLLAERPLYGYQIKKILADEALSLWFPIEDASIYTVLRTLVRRGWAREVGTEQEANRPTRTRYEITSAGRQEYRDLLREAWANPTAPADPVCVALAAEGDLETREVHDLLARREAALRERLRRLLRLRRASPSRSLVAREVGLARAELRWTMREQRSRRRSAR